MTLKYHGLVVDTPESGQLRFGIEPLIGSCQSWVWKFEKDLPKAIQNTLKRFDNLVYWQCAKKCKDTVHKINKAIYNLGFCMDIFERKQEFAFNGAPIDKAAIYFKASDDIPYHLDSLISYLRVLADCIAFAIPFFYRTQESIANRSFREHRKWFMEKKPDFDPDYKAVLMYHSFWFDKLAGKSPKGVRDVIFHNFGTYQLSCTHFPNGNTEIFINQITSEGIKDQDLTFTLREIITGFFTYLDKTYSIFGTRIAEEFSPFVTLDLEKTSVFMNFKKSPNLREKYRLYPLIETGENVEQVI
jgi:hypothetical protein